MLLLQLKNAFIDEWKTRNGECCSKSVSVICVDGWNFQKNYS